MTEVTFQWIRGWRLPEQNFVECRPPPGGGGVRISDNDKRPEQLTIIHRRGGE